MLRWFSGKGEKGDKGDTGATGAPGANGFSPNATVLPTATGATVTIQDHNGITSAVIRNGNDGTRGSDGVSPSATVTQTATGATVTITDANGTTTANLINGTNGERGEAGVSPSASVTPNANGAEISITDANGTTTAQINNGTSGINGVDGVSPTASVAQTATGATVTITDKNGTTTAELTNGKDGTRGSDGVSPTANIQQTATGATITITDQTGTTAANITNGQNGSKGDPGQGVPTGGSIGQVLAKKSATDYDTEWQTPASGGGLELLASFSGTITPADLYNAVKDYTGPVLFTRSEMSANEESYNARVKISNTVDVERYDSNGSVYKLILPGGVGEITGAGSARVIILPVSSDAYDEYDVNIPRIMLSPSDWTIYMQGTVKAGVGSVVNMVDLFISSPKVAGIMPNNATLGKEWKLYKLA